MAGATNRLCPLFSEPNIFEGVGEERVVLLRCQLGYIS